MNSKSKKTNRQRLYGLLAMANKYLEQHRPGWCDDYYRDILHQCGASERNGKYSASTMTEGEMNKALRMLQAKGFVPKKQVQKKATDWRAARIAKLNAMWIEMAESGRVRDRSERAMENWCKSAVPGLNSLTWASSSQLNQAVEMLKKFKER